jgi:hypothetical protein
MKNNEWLTAESFESAHEVVSAINTLSIYAKLQLADLDHGAREKEAAQARDRIASFVDRLANVVQSAERRPDGSVLGVDPRLGELASKFLSERSQLPRRSPLYSVSFAEMRHLLSATTSEDLKKLIGLLRALRVLIEQHAHSDIVGILGDV